MSSIPRQQTTTTSGRARLFPVVVALAILAFGSFAATQHVAAALSYQPALGEPAFILMDVPVYSPLNWLKWFFAYRSIEHPTLDAAFAGAARYMLYALAAAAVAAIFLRYLLTRDLQKATPDLHGTAHWMDADAIKASGLFQAGEGVYVGGWTELVKRFRVFTRKVLHYLRHNGPEHIMVIAPTRSGKGVGIVVPTLLSWVHSVFVYDIKGEAWALTAGWRQSIGHKTLLLDPADPTGVSVKYNPLEEVRVGTQWEVSDVQNLVTMIVDPDGKGLNDHWAKTGHALLVGAVLHVLYSEPNKTLEGVANFLSDPDSPFEDTLQQMLDTEHDTTGSRGWLSNAGEPTTTHPVVAGSARDMLNKADNERSGVLSTAMSFLTLYRDPIVAMNTSMSEFKVADLMNDDVPVDLYLRVRPSDQARLRPFTRLLVNQITRGLTEKMDFANGKSVQGYKHRLLMLMDEFPSLGKMEILQEALAFCAGYGIKVLLIIQDFAQLHNIYGRDETITSNCHIRAAFAPNRVETAKTLSDMTGVTTVVKNTYSYSGKRSKNTMDSISAQVSEVSRPLLTADEVMRLRGATKDAQGNITEAGAMLLFQAGAAPILGTQILYFLDPVFSERAKIEPPKASDRVRSGNPPSARVKAVASGSAPAAALADSAGDAATGLDLADASDDDYESPPLPDHALIPDDGYPDDQGGDPYVQVDDDEPELGSEYPPLTADELRALTPEGDADDTEGQVSGAQGDPEQEPVDDPYLAASRSWATSAGPITFPDLETESSVQDDPAPQDEIEDDPNVDPYIALSRRWASSPASEPVRRDGAADAQPATAPMTDTSEDTFSYLNAMVNAAADEA